MRPRLSANLSYLLVALAALIPRVVGLGQFVTIDEVGGWMLRSARFLAALGTGDLAATAQSAHPGVTTMWLGALGIALHDALAARSLIDPADFATRLGLMQLMPALANAAAVVAGYGLLRRLLAPRLALLAALLWALDPFVIGFNRVLHVDGLMGSFATLSVLAACVYWGLGVGGAAPAWAVDRLAAGVTEEGGEPHQSGNFYLGRPVDVPGPQYYATALAMRLTPITMLGLGLLGLRWRRRARGDQAALAALAWFALLLMLELSLFPKKFDRYLEPAFPAVDILAAAGLLALAEGWRSAPRRALLGGLALAAAANAAWWHPYGIIAYNQLLGGAPMGARTFHMGWGEGMPQVAAWLNRQPGIDEQGTISSSVATLRPYLRPGVGVDLPPAGGQIPPDAGFAVAYLRSAQAGLDPPLERVAATQTPVFTVTIHGVAYAQIYEVVPAPQHELRAAFGEGIVLQGYDLAQGDGRLGLTLHWATAGPPPDVALFVHLLDSAGQRRAQIDLPEVTAGWDGGRHYRTRLALPLPGDLPAGEYALALGLYDPQSFTRLPLSGAPAADPAAAGPDALLLTSVRR
ncbi:DUF4832 domain-containing protein [Oscillochloris sp. ZM17-4]|uniref:DUF4832 domain-containing protein n=1 Tax=Oscillochloris sp. ZM17-4 TaxID=2866714 RepID=UPI001C72A57A|nr:DUF4832 domain-containing protein [Oscillochloris sp. ZM17-4]MBX0330887.1 DUF4832 domain-containing protein [Oscillochloris sp. ZM17-4]